MYMQEHHACPAMYENIIAMANYTAQRKQN
jgi:hypothetical protein